jgi:pyrroline-5-carboxylate reductase
VSLGNIWLVGCGNMGGAMLRGWLRSGIDPATITVIDPGRRGIAAEVRWAPHISELPEADRPDTLILAIKPQQLHDFHSQAPELAPALLVSVLAGVEEATLAALWRADAIVRAMPNLPVAIGKGVTALHTGSGQVSVRDDAATLMAPLGLIEWIGNEELFDAVTALSGCGPGFVFRFIDALAAAGVELGLPADQAQRLALATVEGTGLMAAAATESAATLADRVASPGGSTREGLDVLDRGDALKNLLRDTLAASARRNREMAAGALS